MVHSEKLMVALIQTDLVWEDPNTNREQFSAKINAISQHVDIIILPELFTTGFAMNPDLAERMDGKTVVWMQQLAAKKQVAIVGSIIVSEEPFHGVNVERSRNAQGKKFYNRLLFVHPSGKVDFYDKRHTFTLANEHKVFSAGTEKKIFEYNGWKICPLICYDLRFPVWARNTENYDLLLYVASWPKVRITAWDTLLKARAIENMCYTLGVNRTGMDGNDFEYVGHSIAIDCLGNPLSEEHNKTDEVIIVELDKNLQEKTRNKFGFLNDKDRFSFC